MSKRRRRRGRYNVACVCSAVSPAYQETREVAMGVLSSDSAYSPDPEHNTMTSNLWRFKAIPRRAKRQEINWPPRGILAPESYLGPSSSRHRGPEEASPVSVLEDVGQDAGEQPCAVEDSLALLLRRAAGVGALDQPLHRLREWGVHSEKVEDWSEASSRTSSLQRWSCTLKCWCGAVVTT